jgi:RNA polymerase sigma-70 factor, ECF subfamily
MQSTSTTGDTLIQSIWQFDATALLHLVLRETGGDRQWAEDVVQETLVRAWRTADNIDPARSPRPWLATVARRIIIDTQRRRSLESHEIVDSTVEYACIDHDTEDRTLVRLAVWEAVHNLPAPQRAVILEVYFRGNTTEHAAATLGLPPGTVRSRLYSALRALRAALADPERNEGDPQSKPHGMRVAPSR